MKHIIKDKGTIYCNIGAWEKLQETVEAIKPSKIFILTDQNTNKFSLKKLQDNFKPQSIPEILTIPAGEEHKTIKTCLTVWNELSEKGADRSSLLINLGGGMVTDLGGFVASTFKRGITFINIPTSLLAMVDASVGGKNGVDLGVLKNQIGVVNNALAVFIDTSFLKTLPKNEVTSGYAEMLKHGLIYSKDYWDSLKKFDLDDGGILEEAIWKSIEIKNEIVTIDPTEQNERKALNYGHTLGHAIESFCLENDEKKTLLHGEAIAIGMILSCYISNKSLGFPEKDLESVREIFLHHFQKVVFTNDDIIAIIELLKYDKKNKNGNVYFVLLNSFGSFKTNCIVSNDLIKEAFNYYATV